VRADRSAPLGYVEVGDPDSGLVSVLRNGQRLNPRTPLALEKGDEVRTGPDSAAVIRLANGGEVVLAPNTLVRLGSLEVFFGKVLADLRGLFTIEDETLVAAVEGTRFLFEAERGRQTRVAVLEGRVRCIPKAGGWKPIRLVAGQGLRYSGDREPHIAPLSPAEINDIEHWSRGIREAAISGFCCFNGRVTEAFSNQCRGHFEESRRKAEYECQEGWCCANGKVSRSIRDACGGKFSTTQAAAEKACAAAAPPSPAVVQGWCCLQGNLKQTDSRYCNALQGQFYTNASEGKRRCQRIVQ
jgi:hypothetical protein